jgi:peptidoglycan hydrolase-like protein with peptidoglycan-binding domain
MRAMLRFRTVLATALILGASVAIPIATSGTAEAASCNTTATSNWGNNCLVSTSSYSHSNFVVVIQALVQIYTEDECGSLISIDGYYGSATANAVKCWQAGHGLTADGIVGPQTWSSLGQSITYYDAVGAYYYYVGQDYVNYRMNGTSKVWAYGGPYTGSEWTTMNTATPPDPIWIYCCN